MTVMHTALRTDIDCACMSLECSTSQDNDLLMKKRKW